MGHHTHFSPSITAFFSTSSMFQSISFISSHLNRYLSTKCSRQDESQPTPTTNSLDLSTLILAARRRGICAVLLLPEIRPANEERRKDGHGPQRRHHEEDATDAGGIGIHHPIQLLDPDNTSKASGTGPNDSLGVNPGHASPHFLDEDLVEDGVPNSEHDRCTEHADRDEDAHAEWEFVLSETGLDAQQCLCLKLEVPPEIWVDDLPFACSFLDRCR